VKDNVIKDSTKEGDLKKPIETDGQELNPEILQEIFATNMGEGTLEEVDPEVEDDEDKNPMVGYEHDEDSMVAEGQYADKIVEDVLTHPEKYVVKTSKGEMNLKDAMEEGWDPESDTFDEENSIRNQEEKILGGLGDSDRAEIERMTNPSNAKIPPAEAGQFGIDPTNPMVAGAGGMEEETEIDPAMMDAMMGGM
jgi:hypothetical protein